MVGLDPPCEGVAARKPDFIGPVLPRNVKRSIERLRFHVGNGRETVQPLGHFLHGPFELGQPLSMFLLHPVEGRLRKHLFRHLPPPPKLPAELSDSPENRCRATRIFSQSPIPPAPGGPPKGGSQSPQGERDSSERQATGRPLKRTSQPWSCMTSTQGRKRKSLPLFHEWVTEKGFTGMAIGASSPGRTRDSRSIRNSKDFRDHTRSRNSLEGSRSQPFRRPLLCRCGKGI